MKGNKEDLMPELLDRVYYNKEDGKYYRKYAFPDGKEIPYFVLREMPSNPNYFHGSLVEYPFQFGYSVIIDNEGYKLLSLKGNTVEDDDERHNLKIANEIYKNPEKLLDMVYQGFFLHCADDFFFYVDVIASRVLYENVPDGQPRFTVSQASKIIENSRETLREQLNRRFKFINSKEKKSTGEDKLALDNPLDSSMEVDYLNTTLSEVEKTLKGLIKENHNKELTEKLIKAKALVEEAKQMASGEPNNE